MSTGVHPIRRSRRPALAECAGPIFLYEPARLRSEGPTSRSASPVHFMAMHLRSGGFCSRDHEAEPALGGGFLQKGAGQGTSSLESALNTKRKNLGEGQMQARVGNIILMFIFFF
jgi:hypothetical protein